MSRTRCATPHSAYFATLDDSLQTTGPNDAPFRCERIPNRSQAMFSANLQIPLLDLVIVVVYMVGILAVGILATRRQKMTGDVYFLAGRSLGWITVGAALFASNISTIHVVGLAASGYSEGLVWGNFELAAGLHADHSRPGICAVLLPQPDRYAAGISGTSFRSGVALVPRLHGHSGGTVHPHRDEPVCQRDGVRTILRHQCNCVDPDHFGDYRNLHGAGRA